MGKLFNPIDLAQTGVETIGNKVGEEIYDRRVENKTEAVLDGLKRAYYTIETTHRSDFGNISEHFNRAAGSDNAALNSGLDIVANRLEGEIDNALMSASPAAYLAVKGVVSGVDGFQDRKELHIRSIEAIAGRPRTEIDVLDNNPEDYFDPIPGLQNGAIPGYEAGQIAINGTAYNIVIDATPLLSGEMRASAMMIGPDGKLADKEFWKEMDALPEDIRVEKMGTLMAWAHDAGYELDQFKNEDGTYDTEAYDEYVQGILTDPEQVGEIAKASAEFETAYAANKQLQPEPSSQNPENTVEIASKTTNDAIAPAI